MGIKTPPPRRCGRALLLFSLILGVGSVASFITLRQVFAQTTRVSSQTKKPAEFHAKSLTIGGTVRAIAVAPNGDVYVGGAFTNGSGNPDIDYIARWDGTRWHSLGKGLASSTSTAYYRGVYAIAINGSKVYVGGIFNTTGDGIELNNFARWDMDTNTWEPLKYPCTGEDGECGPGMTTGYVYALAAPLSGSGVFVGGYFNTPYLAPTYLNRIGFYDGTSWSALGQGFGLGFVRTLYVDPFSGSLYAGGVGLGTDTGAYGHLLRWDGSTWHDLDGTWDVEGTYISEGGEGASRTSGVYDIDGADGNIYVAGSIRRRIGTTGTGAAIYGYGVLKYDGANWSKLGSNPIGDDLYTDARAVGVFGSNLLLGGFFDDDRPGTISHRFARWNGSAWNNGGASLSKWDSTAGINSITVRGSQAFVGGSFVNAGGNPSADYIARFDGTTWHAMVNPTPTPTITPTPTPTPIPPTATPYVPPPSGGGRPPATPKPAPKPDAPVVKAIGVSGSRGATVRLPFKITYRGAGTSELVTIRRGKTTVRQIRGSYSPVKSGTTYFFTVSLAGMAKGNYQFCVVSTDNYSRKSNQSCASLVVK